jgi:hypothetical protein
MPEVGFSREPIHYDLKTVEDGFVELRRLPYDEILARREMGMHLSMEQGTRKRSRRQKDEQQKIDIALAQVVTREYEFKSCIVNHNLTVDGVAVDFSQPKLAFKIVDPRILQEIELYLSELNLETDDEELEDCMNAAKPSSSNGATQHETPTEIHS